MIRGKKDIRFMLGLYDKGHNVADYIVEKLSGSELSRDEREEIIQEGFLRLADDIDALRQMTPAERMNVLCECMCKTAIAAGEKPAQDTSLQMTKDEENGDFAHET